MNYPRKKQQDDLPMPANLLLWPYIDMIP
jgi:hypothetical protein